MLRGVLLFLLSCNLCVTYATPAVEVTEGLDLAIGTAHADEPFWLESIKHQGSSAYNPDPKYQVFRNVKNFGAKGDGIADDTAAINLAISSGNRCGGDDTPCNSSTWVISPASVYFPKGTYLVSSPIKTYYSTQLIGDAKNPPTLLASMDFDGLAVIDSNPYMAGGQWFANTNNFLRAVRNFVIDLRSVPPERAQGTGIHWQVAQATALTNIVIEMSTLPGNAHQGVWMENGSGGFMSDLVINGGRYGMWVGNQQFTVRNVTINNADTAIFHHWNWAWTFQGITINDCNVGFEFLSGVSAVSVIDSVIANTIIGVRSAAASSDIPTGSLIVDNLRFINVKMGIVDGNNSSLINGGADITIKSWGQGNIYTGSRSTGRFNQGDIYTSEKPPALLDSAGRIFGRSRPQYSGHSVKQFVSVKDNGAIGDGKSDDTEALQSVLDAWAGRKIVFFDAGTYIVTSTLTIPAGTRMVGEAWSVISGKGDAFADQKSPSVVVRVGEKHSRGVVEISDIIFSTVGPAPGAIVVEWNIRESFQGSVGMWDSHIILGGVAGTELELAECPPSSTDPTPCMAAFLGLHLTPKSSAYIEATWVWLADHDIDGDGASMISLYSGRGVLSQSKGPVWLHGTAEHHVLYQYRLVNAQNHYMGLIQTESPYWQPVPPAPSPFSVHRRTYKDPHFSKTDISSYGLSVEASKNIFVYGGGMYSFYSHYLQRCLETRDCQSKIIDIDSASSVSIFSLSTVASTFQISIDGSGVVNEKDNINGFASTLALWSSSSEASHLGCDEAQIVMTV